ncbi:hypothetical protein [Microbacterium sp. NPDC096154]|uniref:endonuclease domain-containing protein n=1 Tax=Microbacterium sp. NPDC096154 TaxID=3155549 RepID=UPI00331FB65D
MRRPQPLPGSLPHAFTVARADIAGVKRARLRASDLARPFHGTRSVGELTDRERLRLLLDVLPQHALACRTTAAAVLGLPLPWRLERDAFARPEIAVPAPANRIRRPEVRGSALRMGPGDVMTRDGIRLTSPARTWLDLSAVLSVPQLVAVTDRLIGRRRPLLAVDELLAMSTANQHAAGAARRAEALVLADAGSESPRESELRVLLVSGGLPAPEANVVIYDGARFVARVDLLFRAARVVAEYQGDHHRDRTQWSRDEIRRAELESLGYRVTYVTARDFDRPDVLVARIRRLLSAAPPRSA